MRLKPGVALRVALRWSDDDVQPVGRLAWHQRRAWFEYDPAFLGAGLRPSPLHLPVREGVIVGDPNLGGLHGLFHDSLPDAWGTLLVDRRARRLGLDPAHLSLLDRLTVVGRRGMGALVYEPAAALPAEDGPLDLDRLAQDARRVLEGGADEVLPALLAAGGSPGGARPKVLVAWRQEDDHFVHGAEAIPAGHRSLLVKFGAPTDPADMGPIEQAYANMARAAGVRMMPSWLLPSRRGPGFFATERFDRPAGPGHPRLHVHTLAGLLHADHRIPSLDYDALLRVAWHLTRDHREVEAAFRLMVFNVLAHNRDDHGRQFAFLMERCGQWRLAPAYDLTFSQGPGGEHSTSVAGEGRAPGRAQLWKVAETAGIRHPVQIVDEVAEAVAGWRGFAREAGVGRVSLQRIEAVLDRWGA